MYTTDSARIVVVPLNGFPATLAVNAVVCQCVCQLVWMSFTRLLHLATLVTVHYIMAICAMHQTLNFACYCISHQYCFYHSSTELTLFYGCCMLTCVDAAAKTKVYMCLAHTTQNGTSQLLILVYTYNRQCSRFTLYICTYVYTSMVLGWGVIVYTADSSIWHIYLSA